MGGLVSRAALYKIKPETKVKALYTLGSPHAGFPFDSIQQIYGLATNQLAVDNMAESSMVSFNGGDGVLGGFSPLRSLLSLGEGPNDRLVGKYSAVGWNWNQKISDPPLWLNNDKKLGQYWTNEIHSGPYNSYYSAAPGD